MILKAYSSMPAPPTSFIVASYPNDTAVILTWTVREPTASTLVYRDGVLIATLAPGVATTTDSSRTTATNYSYYGKHFRNGLASIATATVVGRPVVVATGGTENTPGDGFKYHEFTTNASFTLINTGTLSAWGAACGGDGGNGADGSGGATLGGGGGAAGDLFTFTGVEPAGVYPVVIGTRVNAGSTTYRSQVALKGANGANAVGDAHGGDGGENSAYGSGTGFASGPGNNAGGGGGAGTTSAGQNAGLFGGPGGTGTTIPRAGLICVGGAGGRVTGNGGDGANYGDGGEGDAGSGNSGGPGHVGIFVVRYPV